MAYFRKKPVVIEAAFFDGTLVGEPDGLGGVKPRTCPDWFPAVMPEIHPSNVPHLPAGKIMVNGYGLHIGTLEGTMTAVPGDWIIRGVQGELYPCKPDIFAETYEAVE